MKRKLIFLAFLCSVLLISLVNKVSAQAFITPNNSYGTNMLRLNVDSTLYIPTGCGVPSDTTYLFSQGVNRHGEKKKKAALYYDSCGHNLYIWDPSSKIWVLVGSGGGGGGTDPNSYHAFHTPNDSTVVFDTPAGAHDTLHFKFTSGGGGGGGPFYDSLLMASVKRLKDTAAAIRATMNANITYFAGSDITLGTINPDSLYGGGKLLRDAHHSGSSLWVHYFDSTRIAVVQPSATGIYPVSFSAVNPTAATAGNPSYGGEFESQGALFVSGSSQVMRAGFWLKPVLNGSAAENQFWFGTSVNHNAPFPLSGIAYLSDNPTGGRIHIGSGDFNQLNLSYQENSANYDMGTSGFIYYNVATSGTFTYTLTTLANSTYNNEVFFENYGTGTLTVKGAGSENLIFNGTTANTFTLAQYKYAKLRVNAAGTAWRVIESN